MAASEVEICNLALTHLAVSDQISSLSDKTKEALACNTFYAQCRDEVLEAFPWPFASIINTPLALVTDYTLDPLNTVQSEWAFSYRMPSDCLTFRRIQSGTRNDSHESRVPYRIAQDDAGELILTDMPDAHGEWTTQITDVTRFSPSFVNALALLLAARIGPTVAGGDQFKLADRAFQLYQDAIQKAHANAYNEEQPDRERQSTFVIDRF